MDAEVVRKEAQIHAEATVAGDFKTAGSSLTPEAMALAGGVMKQMPANLSACEIAEVEGSGDEVVVNIVYKGDGETTVASRWADRDGSPKIVDLKVL